MFTMYSDNEYMFVFISVCIIQTMNVFPPHTLSLYMYSNYIDKHASFITQYIIIIHSTVHNKNTCILSILMTFITMPCTLCIICPCTCRYHGLLSKADAVDKLLYTKEGTYLVRKRTSGQLVISFR